MSKKISWSKFKLEPSKPNLISGWDIFTFTGNNKPNLIENGWDDFEADGGAEIKIINLESGLTRIQTRGGNEAIRLMVRTPTKADVLTVRLKLKNLSEVPIIIRNWRTNSWSQEIKPNEEKVVVLTGSTVWGIDWTMQVRTHNDFIGEPLDFIASDPEIVEAEHPNIKVVMNQENTLMHIKTFGGNDKRKLYGTIGRFPSGSKFQQSIYIENYGPDVYVSGHTGTVERHKIETGYKGWMHFPAWVDGPSWMDFSFGAETPDECLDFKCTLPQIVEGDVPNPELVVQTLEDGREHVRVFGANPNTKLVYDEAGFKGELYSFTTEIENQGTHLKMKSSIGDYEETFDEGTKEIKHEGNLNSAKVEFEVGATDE